MGSDRLHAWFHGSWRAVSLWLWDSLDVLAASGESPKTWHIPWVLWGLLGSMPHNWKCRSHDSQALWFPALLQLTGLWTHCQFIWVDGAGGAQEHLVTLLSQESWNWRAVLSGLTVLWNDVNEVLIISKKLLKKISSVGSVSICIAQGSALPVFPASCLGNYLWTGWQPPCDSQSLGGVGALLQVPGA